MCTFQTDGVNVSANIGYKNLFAFHHYSFCFANWHL